MDKKLQEQTGKHEQNDSKRMIDDENRTQKAHFRLSQLVN